MRDFMSLSCKWSLLSCDSCLIDCRKYARYNHAPCQKAECLHFTSFWRQVVSVVSVLVTVTCAECTTLQRPDNVIFSRALRQVILIELTVPLEDRVCLAHERKRNRYLQLLSSCQSNGWNATHFPVEVGTRGFVAYSLMRCLTQLGFPPYWAKKVRNEASKVSLRCSYLIYLRRNIRVWQERLGD